MRIALAALALAACSSSAAPPKPPASPPPKCAKVADHMVELMPASKGATADNLDVMRRVFNDHCRDDAWTAAAQDCLLAAGSLQDVGARCSDLLTPEQTRALGAALEPEPAPSPTSDAGVVDGV